jgi:hypothetical protein
MTRFRDRKHAVPDPVLAGTLDALQKGFEGRGLILLVVSQTPDGKSTLQHVSNLPPEQMLRIIQSVAGSHQTVAPEDQH